jgi:hypothetical protein
MTLVSDIITDAYRESNLIALNTSPTAPQSAEALTRLQAIIQAALGADAGYILEDWNVTSGTGITNPAGVALTNAQATAWRAKPQARLLCALTAATTIYSDPQPQDGQRLAVVDAKLNFGTYNLTLNGNGRTVEGATTKVFSANGAAEQYIYRADTGNWAPVLSLATNEQMPFPEDFDDYFIIKLAMRINPRYGRPLPAESQARLEEQKAAMIERYGQFRFRPKETSA